MDNRNKEDLFGTQPKEKKLSKRDYGKRKAVVYYEKDFGNLNELLKDPVLRDMMPKKVLGRKNRMVIWCVQKLINIVNNRDYHGQQGSINFSSDSSEAILNEISQLRSATEKMNETLDTLKNKKEKWWKML